MLNANRVLSKAQILDHVWNYDFRGDDNIVESLHLLPAAQGRQRPAAADPHAARRGLRAAQAGAPDRRVAVHVGGHAQRPAAGQAGGARCWPWSPWRSSLIGVGQHHRAAPLPDRPGRRPICSATSAVVQGRAIGATAAAARSASRRRLLRGRSADDRRRAAPGITPRSLVASDDAARPLPTKPTRPQRARQRRRTTPGRSGRPTAGGCCVTSKPRRPDAHGRPQTSPTSTTPSSSCSGSTCSPVARC